MYRSTLGVFLTLALISAGCARDPSRAKADALTRGNQYVAARQFSEAILEYRRALQVDPQFGEARARLGEVYLQSGDVRNALRETVRAADLLPEQADVQIKAGNLLLAVGQFEDARSRAERVISRSPGNVEALVLRGNALASLKDLDGALSDLEKAAAADPQRGLIQSNIGAIQMAKGVAADADAAFRRATELSPNSALARIWYANFLFATNHTSEAEGQLKKAVEAAPHDAMAQRALALLYLSTGRQAEAEPYLRALAEDSKEPESRFALARFYFATNRTEDALRELRTLAARKDSYAEATLEIAAWSYRNGQTAEGRRLLAEVLKQFPSHSRARLLEGEFLVEEHKWNEAIAAAHSALAGNAQLAAAHFVIGVAQQGNRDFDAAKQAFNEVLRLEPNATRAQLALAELHLLNRDAATAQDYAAVAAAKSPRSSEARATLIRAMLANQNLSAAADAIRSFKADFPDDGNAYLLEGTLQLSRRDLAAAEKSLTKAEQLNPDSVPAASGRIQVLLAGGKSAEARQYVQRLMNTHPDRAGFLILGARTYATLKDFSAAEVLLRKTLQLDPSRSETYGLLAQLYVLQGKPDQALAEYQALAAAQPKSVSARTMVGVMLQATHRKQEAKEAYRELLAIDPSAPVAANNLAWMLAEDNENLDVALQLAQTAKAGLPESPSAADTLGWVYLRKGLASQAISEFTEALGRDPENAGFHYRLGFAYAQSGETIQARRSLERALALNGGAPEAAEARATLTRLSRIGL